jgi:hypothetical protein
VGTANRLEARIIRFKAFFFGERLRVLRARTCQEVDLTLEQLTAEVGQTVRAALESWAKTVRLVVLIAVLVSAAAIWTHYCL